jgi:hypothetical protein
LLFLGLKSQGALTLDSLKMESHVDIIGGKETPADEIVAVAVQAKDHLFQCIDTAVKKVQPSSD